jgi:hypothetical protein
VHGIPPDVRLFNEGEGEPSDTTVSEGTQGISSPGRSGYFGPCRPDGETHVYEINVYAVDRVLNLPPSAQLSEVLTAMEGTVISHGIEQAIYPR